MLILVDTNVLLRTAKPDDPAHDLSLQALARLVDLGHEPAIVPQCAYEFYVVATRPVEQNGLGLEPRQAIQDVEDLLSLYRFLRDERVVFELWKLLVAEHEVRGKPAHDARLVAAMKRHEIDHLLTFNAADFERYEPEIIVLEPRTVLENEFSL